jgi:hypothetical protein
MADEKQRYLDARVEGAKTLADSYKNYKRSPTAFVAGVQYALDKLLSASDRFNLPYPAAGVDEVVTVQMLHLLAVDILEKAKRGEPQ